VVREGRKRTPPRGNRKSFKGSFFAQPSPDGGSGEFPTWGESAGKGQRRKVHGACGASKGSNGHGVKNAFSSSTTKPWGITRKRLENQKEWSIVLAT